MISQISHVHQPNFLNKTWRTSARIQETHLVSKKIWDAAEIPAKENFGEGEEDGEKWQEEERKRWDNWSQIVLLEAL